MAHSLPSPPQDVSQPNKKKIMSHGKERAMRLGLLGFSSNFKSIQNIEQYHQILPVEADEDLLFAVDENSLDSTLNETHRALVSFAQQNKWLKRNEAEVASVEGDLDIRLVKSGMPETQVKTLSLTTKIKHIVELSQPQPLPNYVTVLIKDGGSLESTNLPGSASFAQALQILRGAADARCLARCHETGGNPRTLQSATFAWKYQLLRKVKDKSELLPTSVTLKNEDDWALMMRKITGNHKAEKWMPGIPIAILARIEGTD